MLLWICGSSRRNCRAVRNAARASANFSCSPEDDAEIVVGVDVTRVRFGGPPERRFRFRVKTLLGKSQPFRN